MSVEIDNRFEIYAPYKSLCSRCKYLDINGFKCDAFPKGIPDEYLTGKKEHKEIDSRQENGNNVVYQKDSE